MGILDHNTLYFVPICTADPSCACDLPESAQKLLFRLPKLQKLSICDCFSAEFLKLFRESPNINHISLINTGEICLEDIKTLMNHEDPVWSQLKSFKLCEDMEIVDPDAAPEEILDLIAHGAKAGVKVEYGFVAKREARCWLNDGEDEWRFEEEIREREKRLWNTAL
ncbi:hypothetical protein PGT21_016671 [Puccinia graminis f. sp. tritici]|uniref:Uncharacterized protein n=1 Tax=Puccinia graminis f. sp. tritici TaxID=56615 RepID=A0A5B0MKX6_PUCGR|nr:hypothetical protein PGT21_016671 [Puccinia graminis f. sp. tritici]